MCGICGIYYQDRKRVVERWRIENMKHSLKHRGPDDSGELLQENLGFGHQRLSIIDLMPSGHQPMTDANERYWIIFNGEIYNYIELREQLIQQGFSFRSHSDTEVILFLYINYGQDCLQYLNGMFSFAIWDTEERTLFAARDRLGIKPFYYAITQKSFVFASEIKALFASGLIEPELNNEGVKDYLTFQFCLDDKTMFKGIRKLLPGHYLWVGSEGRVSISQYWNLDFTVDVDHSETYFENQLRELLHDAVKIQLRADVPVGSHLSGGLDSSSVACLASAILGNPIHTFSGGFREGPQYDETEYARLVAKRTGSNHHEIFPTKEDFVGTLPDIIFAMDEPAAGPGLFPQALVSRLASQNVKVVLGGQGADELFGGYTRYLIAYLEECIKGGINGTQEDQKYIVTLDSILPNLQQLNGYQPLLKYFWKEDLFESQDSRYFRLINHGRDMQPFIDPDNMNSIQYDPFQSYCDLFNQGNLKSYLNKMTRFDTLTLLPALLQVEDRTSMMVSLESRVPLLDHRIVELAARMPPMIKYKGGRSKFIFRKVVENIVPTEVFDRKDKMGFPVPLNEWYGQPLVKDFIHETLLGKRARQRGWVNPKTLESSQMGERNFGRGMWGMLCLELWMQAYFNENKWKRQ
jgi:asparagine synthase (glutamine-hydrolysing)